MGSAPSLRHAAPASAPTAVPTPPEAPSVAPAKPPAAPVSSPFVIACAERDALAKELEENLIKPQRAVIDNAARAVEDAEAAHDCHPVTLEARAKRREYEEELMKLAIIRRRVAETLAPLNAKIEADHAAQRQRVWQEQARAWGINPDQPLGPVASWWTSEKGSYRGPLAGLLKPRDRPENWISPESSSED
jgi:hypothetical protein